jgi:hypothetical protein
VKQRCRETLDTDRVLVSDFEDSPTWRFAPVVCGFAPVVCGKELLDGQCRLLETSGFDQIEGITL